MKTAIIYCRVSTLEQADGTSLESQLAACRKYADQHDYKVLEMFQESKSGASLNRPMMDRVRELVRAGGVDAVIFYALDRLSRDETDTLILAREWRSRGVEMKCATVSLEDTPQGQFMLTMLAAVGKLERAGIIERFMRGKRQTAKNGKVIGSGRVPYGYRYIKGEGRYEVNEEEAMWVRRIFQWYVAEGLSLYSVTKRLYEMGAPTKQRGNYWNTSTVRGFLTNETYTGELWWGKYDTTGDTRKLRPREEWIGPIHVQPLISREVYEAAQRQIDRNKAMSMRNCRGEYLLRGLLTCELCGKTLVGALRQGGKKIYLCLGKDGHKAIGRPLCKSHQIQAPEWEERVWEWLSERLNNPDLIASLIETPDGEERRQRERDDADLRALVEVEAELAGEEDRLIDLYTHNAINLEKFQERRVALEDRRTGNIMPCERLRGVWRLGSKLQPI
jgi:site-specific DNA recombinase